MIRPRIPAVAWILLSLAGCNTQPPSAPSLAAVRLAGGAHCAHAEMPDKAVWIDDAAGLNEAYNALDTQRLGAPAPRAELDLARYAAVAVFMGRKPTAGYALSLGDPELSVRNKTAELRLVFETPPPDSLTAQVITSPCILVGLPRAGYTALRIVDQHGKLRHQLTVNNDP